MAFGSKIKEDKYKNCPSIWTTWKEQGIFLFFGFFVCFKLKFIGVIIVSKIM